MLMPVQGIGRVMSLSDAALLEETKKAIDALTTGQVSSYSLNGRSVTRLNLAELWNQRTRLEAIIASASRGSFGKVIIRGVS